MGLAGSELSHAAQDESARDGKLQIRGADASMSVCSNARMVLMLQTGEGICGTGA